MKEKSLHSTQTTLSTSDTGEFLVMFTGDEFLALHCFCLSKSLQVMGRTNIQELSH